MKNTHKILISNMLYRWHFLIGHSEVLKMEVYDVEVLTERFACRNRRRLSTFTTTRLSLPLRLGQYIDALTKREVRSG